MLVTAPDESSVPRHLGIVLDGNRRWARQRGLSIAEGHRHGLAKAPEVLGWCEKAGLEVVTLWLLSTDNLRRRGDELRPLFGSLAETVDAITTIGRWRVRHIGRSDDLSPQLSAALTDAEAASVGRAGMTVNLAIGYGGRDEIVRAVRRLLARTQEPGMDMRAWSDDALGDRLAGLMDTAGQPDPELIIRTSGEHRTSGFLLWQTAHTEF